LFVSGGENNTHIRSVRLESLEGFNARALRGLLHQAVRVDADPTLPPLPKKRRAPLPLPGFLSAALKSHPKAAAGFRALSESCRREYIVWVRGAKREETRARRLAETLAAVADGRRWEHRKLAGRRVTGR
jgi:uncharacterized protein YdeI (YjbR/CyaY-like superfamily)